MREFYRHFAQAYGTLWIVVVAFALVTQNDIALGEWGMFGFPVAALAYAFRQKMRQSSADDRTSARQPAH